MRKVEQRRKRHPTPQLENALEQLGSDCNREVRARPISPKRRQQGCDLEKKPAEDWLGRLSHKAWQQPYVMGFVLQHNRRYNNWRFDAVWLDK